MSFLDRILTGVAKAFLTADGEVDTSTSDGGDPGDVLTRVDATHAAFLPGTSAAASLRTSGGEGATVNVSLANPPVAGAVLTASDPTHGVWRTASVRGVAAYVLVPPTNPNALDDEFEEGGSADFATRGGWIFRNETTATVMTRVGEVELTTSAGPTTPLTANQYRSTLHGSTIYVQLPATTNTYTLYKTFTAHALGAFRYYLRASCASLGSGFSNPATSCALGLSNTSGFSTASGAATFLGSFYEGAIGGQSLRQWVAGGSDTFAIATHAMRSPDIFVWENGHAWMVDHLGGQPLFVNNKAFAPTPNTIGSAGILLSGSTTHAGGSLVAIDYFRRGPAGSWFSY